MSKDEYLITDTPLKALTVFAMPMILGSFFQQIYNMADSLLYKEDFAWIVINSKRLNFRHGYKNPRPHFCNRSTLIIHI